MHQGDTDTRKGLYHINAVDTVTQWQGVGCCETISKAHLIPVLEAFLHQFPFRIRGFHPDNGSEFLNRRVAKLLNKLLVGKFTKSRAHSTTDNGLFLEQSGDDLHGTHVGEATAADIRGRVEGNRVHFMARHRYEGSGFGFTFSGQLNGDTMEGEVDLGEYSPYGPAKWFAKRHEYGRPGPVFRPQKNV